MVANSAKPRRARVNKNKKKSWRKFTDIADVEKVIEEQRLQKRTGGEAEKKKDTQLFFVDKKADSLITVDTSNVILSQPGTPALGQQKPTKTKRGKVISKKDVEKFTNYKTTQVKQKAARKRIEAEQAEHKFNRDLWATEDEKITDEGELYRRKAVGLIRPKATKTVLQKPNKISMVELPDAGTSYNPDYSDHQKLLRKAVSQEEDFLKEQQEDEDKLAVHTRATKEDIQRDRMEERMSGLFKEEKVDEEKVIPDDQRVVVHPPTRRKTAQQRKKLIQRKVDEGAAKRRLRSEAREERFNNLAEYKADTQRISQEMALRAIRKEDFNANVAPYQTKQVGETQYQEPSIEVQLSEEIAGSMRLIKPVSGVLHERTHSLQKRNIIPTADKRRRVTKVKGTTKRYMVERARRFRQAAREEHN